MNIAICGLSLFVALSPLAAHAAPPDPARPCLTGQTDKLPEACKQELDALIEENQSLATERDALREDLAGLKERIEQGRVGELSELKPLEGDSLSSEGWGLVRWGMSKVQVRKEYPKARARKDRLTLTKTVADVSATIALVLERKRLSRVELAFRKVRFAKVEELVEEYNRLKDLLTDKYGPPRSDQTDLSARGSGEAISKKGSPASGQIELTTTWVTPKTEIELSCRGKLNDVQLQIDYASRELALAEKQRLLKDL